MSAWYNAARTAVLKGDIDFETTTLKMVLLGDTYTFNADHAVADLTAAVAAGPITITVAAVENMMVTIDDVTFPAVTDSLVVVAAAAYVDDGTDEIPVAYIDRRGDSVPIKPTVGDGGSITFVFDYLVRL